MTLSSTLDRLRRAVGLDTIVDRMAAHRDPDGRTAVLRPENRELAIRRLAEWEAILDGAADDVHAQERAKIEADALWLETKREQAWAFVGWLSADGKRVVDDTGIVVGDALPGDLHEREKHLPRWR